MDNNNQDKPQFFRNEQEKYDWIKSEIVNRDYTKESEHGYIKGYLDCMNDFNVIGLHERMELDDLAGEYLNNIKPIKSPT